MKTLIIALAAMLLTACAGKIDYIRPTATVAPGSNSKVIDKPREAVWSAAVPELGKRFFVINNLDKSSGLINISYTGDPEKYVDCGRIISFVKNARGERTYNFAGSSAQQSYEILESGGLFFIDRRMSLEGRVNLIFEEVSANQTRITANTRYVVQRVRAIRAAANNASQTLTDSVSFNSGSSANFAGQESQAAQCAATGNLEQEILNALR